MTMVANAERRANVRRGFLWPVWFGYEPTGRMHRGQAVDLCEQGVSFTVAGDQCPSVGDHILTRFSFPLTDRDAFEMDSYRDWGQVVSVTDAPGGRQRVSLRLQSPVEMAVA